MLGPMYLLNSILLYVMDGGTYDQRPNPLFILSHFPSLDVYATLTQVDEGEKAKRKRMETERACSYFGNLLWCLNVKMESVHML